MATQNVTTDALSGAFSCSAKNQLTADPISTRQRHPLPHPAVTQLKRELSRRKVTYDRVAEKTALSRSHIANVMSGRVKMPIHDFNLIVESFDLPLSVAGGQTLDITALPPDCCAALQTLVSRLCATSS